MNRKYYIIGKSDTNFYETIAVINQPIKSVKKIATKMAALLEKNELRSQIRQPEKLKRLEIRTNPCDEISAVWSYDRKRSNANAKERNNLRERMALT